MKKIVLIAATALMLPIAAQGVEEFTANTITPSHVEVGIGDEDVNGRIRRYICYAENRRGDLFRAVGSNARRTQRRAMNTCFQYSYECRPLGCQRIR